MMSDQSSLWDQTGGKVGDDHPLTSHKAAATVRSGSQKAQILRALWAVWPDRGYTGYDLSARGLVLNGAGQPISPNQTCTRLLELREAGLVEFKREFPGGPIVEAVTTPGNTGQVHCLTSHGYKTTIALAAHEREGVTSYTKKVKDPYIARDQVVDRGDPSSRF
jgi:hypothetical protein